MDALRPAKFTIPGLDGLRALAVLAVISFHSGISNFFPGGYLGVDVFFSISGFLITRLMLDEYARTQSFDVLGFFGRRLKRLYPVLLVVLFVSELYAVFFARDALPALHADFLSSLFYYSNYDQLAHELPYFEQFMRPHPFQHLWSLAVEMHFYLVWPLLFLSYGRGPQRFRAAVVLFALGFTLWGIVWVIQMNVPIDVRPEKFYFRTDTRVADILLGAALAMYFNPQERVLKDRGPEFRSMLVAWLALVGLTLAFLGGDESSYALYRGGFTLVSLATCVLIVLGATPRTLFYQFLNAPVLVALGKRSYSLYLWHWPVFTFLRPREELPQGAFLAFAIRVAVSLALTELSYRLIERRFQGPWLRAYGRASWAVYGGFLAFFVGTVVYGIALPTPAPEFETTPVVGLGPVVPPSVSESHPNGPPVASPREGASPAQALTPAPKPYPLSASSIRVTAIGDSVLLGARPYIESDLPTVHFDAVVGRQGSEALKVIEGLAARHELSEDVLLHIGTNGTLYEPQFKKILDLLADKRSVVIFNIHADRRWTEPNNQLLEKYRALYPRYLFVDWNAVALHHPEYFRKDGIHLTVEGMRVFAALAKQAFGVPDAPETHAPLSN